MPLKCPIKLLRCTFALSSEHCSGSFWGKEGLGIGCQKMDLIFYFKMKCLTWRMRLREWDSDSTSERGQVQLLYAPGAWTLLQAAMGGTWKQPAPTPTMSHRTDPEIVPSFNLFDRGGARNDPPSLHLTSPTRKTYEHFKTDRIRQNRPNEAALESFY